MKTYRCSKNFNDNSFKADLQVPHCTVSFLNDCLLSVTNVSSLGIQTQPLFMSNPTDYMMALWEGLDLHDPHLCLQYKKSS